MNAAAPIIHDRHFWLPPTEKLPRYLKVTLRDTNSLRVSVYAPDQVSTLGFAMDDMARCRIRHAEGEAMPMLWIGCASFDVTDSQAKALEQALGDFGLRRVGA